MSNTPDNSPPSDSSAERSPLDDADHPPSRPTSLRCEVLIDQQIRSPATAARLRSAVAAAALHRGCSIGEIGVRVTDDASIQQLNRDHLGHDYATDVISFGYSLDPPHVEGELVVSADTARREAERIGWSDEHELLLYAVHGTLHITGMDDQQPGDRHAMRLAEHAVLAGLNISGAERFGADCEPGNELSGELSDRLSNEAGPAVTSPHRVATGQRPRDRRGTDV